MSSIGRNKFKIGDYVSSVSCPVWKVIYNCPYSKDLQVWKRVRVDWKPSVELRQCRNCNNHKCPVKNSDNFYVVRVRTRMFKMNEKVPKLKALLEIENNSRLYRND